MILARALKVVEGIEGIKDSGRNTPDVKKLNRPAIVIFDGSELVDAVQSGDPLARVYRMAMTTLFQIMIGANNEDVGTICNLYRARLLSALFNDAELVALLMDRGMSLETTALSPPDTLDSRESRMHIEIRMLYPLRIFDLSNS